MDEHEIANKYVLGQHNALTDSQERIDMANDIMDFAKAYHEEQVKKDLIAGVGETLPTRQELDAKWKKLEDTGLDEKLTKW